MTCNSTVVGDIPALGPGLLFPVGYRWFGGRGVTLLLLGAMFGSMVGCGDSAKPTAKSGSEPKKTLFFSGGASSTATVNLDGSTPPEVTQAPMPAGLSRYPDVPQAAPAASGQDKSSQDKSAAPSGRSSQWGGSSYRNNVASSDSIPTQWKVGQFDLKTGKWLSEGAEHIQWAARLGNQTYGSPVVASGCVFVATNNGAGYLDRYPKTVDLGCLLCFRQSDGAFLWQYSSEKLASGAQNDWPDQGICCAPLVEDDRLWCVTNRGEVVCLDVQGFQDGEDDGPVVDKQNGVGGAHEADTVWRLDMMKQLHIFQHNMCSCSVTALGDVLFVNTSNGVDESHEKIPAPDAPSFIAVDKHTGKVLWTDRSPGRNILHGQWSSPAAGVLGGVAQVIFAGGDGWVYSFRADGGVDGKPELLWKFDVNPKTWKWGSGGAGKRNNIISTPVIHDGLVYVASGQDPEYGEGPAYLWCINPNRRGDVSPWLAVAADDHAKILPPRRVQAVDPDQGEEEIDNPNSAAVWGYHQNDVNGDGEIDFEEEMHRAIGMAAIQDGLLVIADFSGLLHCLDAKTGKVHWTYDLMAPVWGSPLIVGGHVYVADEEGDVRVFNLSAKPQEPIAEVNMGDSIYTTPVVADGTLYISTRSYLFAIRGKP